MGILSSSVNYIYQESVVYKNAVSESILTRLGSSINYCLDISTLNGMDTFTSSGTWVCPSTVYRVYLFGVGGGQGGSAVYYDSGLSIYFGGNGGRSSIPHLFCTLVTPGASYSVTVGSGGLGTSYIGQTSTSYGGAGGYTQFGTAYRWLGAQSSATVASDFYSGSGGGGSNSFSGSGVAGNGINFSLYTGGIGGSHFTGDNGGGGAAALGNGGNGGTNVAAPTAGSGYGSGGGGGGGGGGGNSSGANGAPGVLYIIY